MQKDSQHTIQRLYEVLDFQNSENLVTEEPEEIYKKTLFLSARKKLGLESIFFYTPPSGGVSIPYIYFCHLEGKDLVKTSLELANLHKIAWNMGRAPLLFVALPDGQIRIHNTYACPSEPDSGDYQTGLIDALNIFSDAEKARGYHRREFESGHFWQQNRNRFNPKNRADYTLLENLKVMRHKLIELLLEQKISLDLASEMTHRLLGRAIFIKYLEDRKDSFGNNVFAESKGYFSGSSHSFLEILSDLEATTLFS